MGAKQITVSVALVAVALGAAHSALRPPELPSARSEAHRHQVYEHLLSPDAEGRITRLARAFGEKGYGMYASELSTGGLAWGIPERYDGKQRCISSLSPRSHAHKSRASAQARGADDALRGHVEPPLCPRLPP